MAVERKFIKEAVKKVRVDLFIRHQLAKVGCGDIHMKRMPLGTRIVIHATKPGLVIGRKGKNIQDLTEALKDKFNLEKPQLEVEEVSVPEFNPDLMVRQLASTLERGIHFRRASYSMVRQIMRKGALGVQIEVSGKLSGTRARREKFKEGYIKHCGETANLYVKEATTQANLKPGVVGIKIKITPPMKLLFNELKLQELKEEKPKTGEKKEEGAKPEEKPEEKPKEEKPKAEAKEVKKEKKPEKQETASSARSDKVKSPRLKAKKKPKKEAKKAPKAKAKKAEKKEATASSARGLRGVKEEGPRLKPKKKKASKKKEKK